ncbi:MAG TPA: hypothetical protein VM821_05815 [Abditibacteriaceae bacterium]|jgi:hypothetical protein|nr:hypothetical protein [Abditibacteriaceae bacterium]
MARDSSEEFDRDVEISFFGAVICEIIGIAVFLFIGAAIFWLTDKLNPNFASAVAQGNSDFILFLFGAAAIATLAAVWWFRKSEDRRDRQNHAARNREAEFGRNCKKELVQK